VIRIFLEIEQVNLPAASLQAKSLDEDELVVYFIKASSASHPWHIDSRITGCITVWTIYHGLRG